MNQPKEFTVEDQQGTTHIYMLGKIPYMGGGREVCSQYISTAAPKVGDYPRNEELAKKLFKHVSKVLPDGTQQTLSTDALIDNHIPDFVTGLKVEAAALEHNVGFSILGKLQEFQTGWAGTFQELITKILIQLRQPSSPPKSQRSKNSAKSTQQKTLS